MVTFVTMSLSQFQQLFCLLFQMQNAAKTASFNAHVQRIRVSVQSNGAMAWPIALTEVTKTTVVRSNSQFYIYDINLSSIPRQ